MARRSGGRSARVALRAAPLSERMKPVRAGELGGQYRPLSESDIDAIIETVYRVLAEIGFADATEHCIDSCVAAGADYGDDQRLRFPRALVDRTIAMAHRNLVLCGQDARHDLQIAGRKVHFATAGAAVMIADSEACTYRESTAQDLYDLARIADTCEHIHMFQRMCVLRDVADNLAMDVNTLYCSIMGTSKHVGSSWVDAEHLKKSLALLHLVAGDEATWRARPFVSQSNCFVVPPMKFTFEALECLRYAVEGGMPVLLLSAGQAGATTPACLAGAVAQSWAECLGGLAYLNAIQPGAPAIIGAWPFISDLRTGAMSGGSPEQGLLSAACAQLAERFNLPFGTACGMTDSKLPDFQGGAERAANLLAPALSGANIVYEAAGMYASLLGACSESLLLDNDVLGATLRMTRGIEVNQETLSFETMKEVCLGGVGHYLGSTQTLEVMQTEYIYPDLGDRSTPLQWEEAGKPDVLAKARAKRDQILATHVPQHINDETDRRIRAEFPIHLSREAMGR